MSIVQTYFEKNYRVVIWPSIGDLKGPKERGWTEKQYTLSDYAEGHRVGLMTGAEIAPGRFLVDIDIDWAPGVDIALKLLPPTEFVFGRASKKVSHCLYTVSAPLPSFRYEDIDKTCLIEFRGTKTDGHLGFQTMVPPSVWSKGDKREQLVFIKSGEPTFTEPLNALKQASCLSAIGMIVVRHCGVNGFGHDMRLAWAGFLLRAGIPVSSLIVMGEAISRQTNNIEIEDVRRVVEGTAARMLDPKQKIKGAPAFAKLLGEKGKAVVERINEWLGHDSDFIRRDGAIVKDSQENISRAVQLLDNYFAYDEFSERMLVKSPEGPSWRLLDDRTITSLWLKIDTEFLFRPTFTFFEKVVMNLCYQNLFHPVRDYLAMLVWDGIPRVDMWLCTYGRSDDTEYHRAVSALVLLAAVRRIKDPGCKFDEMLVLESDQGLNKSSALRALCPEGAWFSDDLPLNIDAKQMIERTLGKWIIEASDLAGKRKADIEQLKATLSRQTDGPARLAYARTPVERARQFVIIGTTNSEKYLSDSTGARRFWPVAIGKFDVEGVLRDRDQLWAEAVIREARGESIRLREELWPVAGEHQELRRSEDPWEDAIQELLELRMPESDGKVKLVVSEIWEVLGIEASRRDAAGAKRISEVMRKLGYKRHVLWRDGKAVRGYISAIATKLDFEV